MMNEEIVGKIPMTAKGLRHLADAIETSYGAQTVRMPVWKSPNHTYFQLEIGTGAINLVGGN